MLGKVGGSWQVKYIFTRFGGRERVTSTIFTQFALLNSLSCLCHSPLVPQVSPSGSLVFGFWWGLANSENWQEKNIPAESRQGQPATWTPTHSRPKLQTSKASPFLVKRQHSRHRMPIESSHSLGDNRTPFRIWNLNQKLVPAAGSRDIHAERL